MSDVMPAEMDGAVVPGSQWTSSPYKRFWRVSEFCCYLLAGTFMCPNTPLSVTGGGINGKLLEGKRTEKSHCFKPVFAPHRTFFVCFPIRNVVYQDSILLIDYFRQLWRLFGMPKRRFPADMTVDRTTL